MKEAQVCGAILASGDPPDASSTVAVVADRRLSVAALSALLLNDSRRSLAEAVRGLEEVRAALHLFRPVILVAEVSTIDWPTGLDPAAWNGRTLLLLDPEDDAEAFVRAVRSRVQGYMSRTASSQALETALETLRSTGYYLDPVLAGRILWASEESRNRPSPVPEPELSQRERDILARIAVGRSSKEIAREYAVSAKTVCNHISNIYAKLNFSHRGQLVLYAAQQGLTTL